MVRAGPATLAFLALLTTVVAAAMPETAAAKGRGRSRTTVTEIIVHATGGPSCTGGRIAYSDPGTVERMKKFFEGSGGVSIHYIVGPDGTIAASVPEGEVAIHTVGHNETSIGIEMINRGDGREPFPDAQVAAMVRLVDGIRRRHNIPIELIKRHSDVDTSTIPCAGQPVRRKQDPGPAFPWDRFLLGVLTLEPPPVTLVARTSQRR
jgi:N-acetylmuramoyl-L-alanine amidase